PLNRVTHNAGAREKHLLSALLPVIARGRRILALAAEPCIELALRLGDNDKTHMCVLHAAVFSALAAIYTRPSRAKPGGGRVTGNQILFTVEVRRPEAVNHVGGAQLKLHSFIDGHVN